MPVTYQINKSRGLIRTTCAGAVAFKEILEHFRTLETDSECPDRLDVLLDLSDQTSMPTSDKLRGVVREIGRVRSRVQFVNCAIVASNDELFGMLRMFEVFAEGYFGKTYVFRSVEDAEAWLDSIQRVRAAQI